MLRALLPILIILPLGTALHAGAEPVPEPDWNAVQRDAVAILQDLVRLDTSQPRGNELLAARYLRDRLAREGISATLYESAPGRANVVARLQGTGDLDPLLLVGHLDVVPAEVEHWGVDPFGGIIRGGRMYGRGTTDAKELVAAAFTLLIHAARLEIGLKRDLVVLAVADEENGGNLGIDYMLAEHPEELRAAFALNEGGGGEIDPASGRYLSFNVGTGEKTPRRARLTVSAEPGHGSVPSESNAIVLLSEAITRIAAAPLQMRLNDTTRAFFAKLAEANAGPLRELYLEMLAPEPSLAAQEQLRALNPNHYSMTRTSVVPTVISGGYLQNVIPSNAEATLDIRALPDEDPEALFEELQQIADVPGLRLIPLKVNRPPHPPSPLDNELYGALRAVLSERHPDALILPTMNPGASDSAQLRAAGIPTYGFGPGVLQGEAQGMHGNDENLLLSAYHEYLRILWAVIARVAVDQRASSR